MELINILLPVISSLIGVIIGGWINHRATVSIELRRWEQQKEERRLEQQREAVGLALEWLDPIDQAINKALLISHSYHNRVIEKNEAMREWPELLSELSRRDVPPRLQVWLPPESNTLGLFIVNGLRHVRDLTTDLNLDEDGPGNDEKFKLVTQTLDKLQKSAATLREQLTTTYMQTYD